MHEVIKKSIRKFDNKYSENLSTLEMDMIRHDIIHSHITLAEEKIKELEGEMKPQEQLRAYDQYGNGYIGGVKNSQYNQAKQEEIDKWKQFISELKEL